MITKDETEIILLRESGRRLAEVMRAVVEAVVPGVSPKELDSIAEGLIVAGGDVPAFLKYKPEGAPRPYPATLCVSVNDEIVHGIPNEKSQFLKEGDIVGLDLGLTHKGFITDMAVTVPVGNIDKNAQQLIATTREALSVAIEVARTGNHIGDIGHAIEKFVAGRYSIVRELGGHGVGNAVHEDPFIPNFGVPGTGTEIVSGMVLALEPMLNEGGEDIKLSSDGYTVYTADGKRSAHFEHTILITKEGVEILTE